MSINDTFINNKIKMKHKSSYGWWQRVISTQRSVWDVRRYLKTQYKNWKDLYEVLESLYGSDRKEADYLSLFDEEIVRLFQMSLDAA